MDTFDLEAIAKVNGTTVGDMSDGYHTFDELYEHRYWLFLALLKQHGPTCVGKQGPCRRLHVRWRLFIAGMTIGGKQIRLTICQTGFKACRGTARHRLIPHPNGTVILSDRCYRTDQGRIN